MARSSIKRSALRPLKRSKKEVFKPDYLIVNQDAPPAFPSASSVVPTSSTFYGSKCRMHEHPRALKLWGIPMLLFSDDERLLEKLS